MDMPMSLTVRLDQKRTFSRELLSYRQTTQPPFFQLLTPVAQKHEIDSEWPISEIFIDRRIRTNTSFMNIM